MKKQVRFSPTNNVLIFESYITSMNKDEKNALWYEKYDIAAFRALAMLASQRRRWQLESMMEQQQQQQQYKQPESIETRTSPVLVTSLSVPTTAPPPTSSIDDDDNDRGLEFLSSNYRRRQSRMVVLSVIKVQKKIKNRDFTFLPSSSDVYAKIDESVLLSKVSRKFSDEARLEGIKMGLDDERMAREVYDEDYDDEDREGAGEEGVLRSTVTPPQLSPIPSMMTMMEERERLDLPSRKRRRDNCWTKDQDDEGRDGSDFIIVKKPRSFCRQDQVFIPIPTEEQQQQQQREVERSYAEEQRQQSYNNWTVPVIHPTVVVARVAA